jgi:hypothetical protein
MANDVTGQAEVEKAAYGSICRMGTYRMKKTKQLEVFFLLLAFLGILRRRSLGRVAFSKVWKTKDK